MSRIDYLDTGALADELDELRERDENASDEDASEADKALALDEDERARLAALTTLEDDLGGDIRLTGRDRGPFINERDWTDYARELAEETGYTKTGWPYDYIDWERAADALRSDYADVTFEGETYYYCA